MIDSSSTATYNLFTEQGELKTGVGDMSIHSQINPVLIKSTLSNATKNRKHSLVVLDGNLSEAALDCCLRHSYENEIPVFFEPADVKKAGKVVNSEYFTSITFSSPNVHELQVLSGKTFETENVPLEKLLQSCIKSCESLLNVIQVVIVTLGKHGVLIARNGSPDDPLPLTNSAQNANKKSFKHYPVPNIINAKSVSGAGDCFVAAFIKSVLEMRTQDEAVSSGMQAASISLQAFDAVPVTLNCDSIDWNQKAKGILLQ